MPHICTRCNSVFESGEDILRGCPSCGWKKFMFVRKVPQVEDRSRAPPDQIITRAMGVKMPPKRGKVSLGMDRSGPLKKEFEPDFSADRPATAESTQKSPAEMPDSSNKISEADRQSELHGSPAGVERALESVKITAPGTYELNLPSLFERDELIMAVKEGTYFIDLTSAFKKSKRE